MKEALLTNDDWKDLCICRVQNTMDTKIFSQLLLIITFLLEKNLDLCKSK